MGSSVSGHCHSQKGRASHKLRYSSLQCRLPHGFEKLSVERKPHHGGETTKEDGNGKSSEKRGENSFYAYLQLLCTSTAISHIYSYYVNILLLRKSDKLSLHKNNSLMLLKTCPLGQALAGSRDFHFAESCWQSSRWFCWPLHCTMQQSAQIWRDPQPAAAEVPDAWRGTCKSCGINVDWSHWTVDQNH